MTVRQKDGVLSPGTEWVCIISGRSIEWGVGGRASLISEPGGQKLQRRVESVRPVQLFKAFWLIQRCPPPCLPTPALQLELTPAWGQLQWLARGMDSMLLAEGVGAQMESD